MSYLDPVQRRLGEWGARPPRTGGAIVMFGDTPPADPWAKQGEGTVTASADPGAAVAALLAAPVNALQSLFSAVSGQVKPDKPGKPPKRSLPILPLAIAGAAVVGLVLFIKKKAQP